MTQEEKLDMLLRALQGICSAAGVSKEDPKPSTGALHRPARSDTGAVLNPPDWRASGLASGPGFQPWRASGPEGGTPAWRAEAVTLKAVLGRKSLALTPQQARDLANLPVEAMRTMTKGALGTVEPLFRFRGDGSGDGETVLTLNELEKLQKALRGLSPQREEIGVAHTVTHSVAHSVAVGSAQGAEPR